LEQPSHIKLSELGQEIQKTLEASFSNQLFWVVADVTNHSFKEKSNYHYFDLVEKRPGTTDIVAKINGKAWGTGSVGIREFERITGQKFTNNINVLVQVRVSFHAVFGLSVDIVNIDTNFTIGILEQQRLETLRLLVEKNPEVISKIGDTYHTRNKALPLGTVIQRVALVASKSSAGRQDFVHTLESNQYGYRFLIDEYHTVVQNEANVMVLRQAMIDIFNSQKHYDAVVIIRGGGAQTDFLIFDNYQTGLVVAKFPIPIITGIGHQKNETVTDLMAHTATKTPTKAAEFIINHNRNFEDEIINFQKQIIIRSQQLFSTNFQSLSTLNSTVVNKSRTFLNDYKDLLVAANQVVINKTKSILYNKNSQLNSASASLITKPRMLTGSKINDLSNLRENLKVFSSKYAQNQKGYLAHYASMIRMMAPDNILKKGFAIVKQNGAITSDAKKFIPGSDIEVILSSKSIKGTVKTNSDYNGNDFDI
jgi:exodeoxyribonuclease VII large subunit